MIRINNVFKTYGNNEFKAVNGVCLEVMRGEIFGFLGPNGSGKTTTIKMVTGVLRPDKGDIEINGIDIQKYPVMAKRHIGFVPDNPEIFLRLTGLEYLRFIADIYDVPTEKRVQKIEEFAEMFEIKDVLSSPIKSFSRGMKQKLGILGAILPEPEILILDEPLVGLDTKSAYTLKNIMRQYADAGRTVLFSTHIIEVAEKVCDRIGIIKKGNILYTGTIEELKEHAKLGQNLEDLFMEMIEK